MVVLLQRKMKFFPFIKPHSLRILCTDLFLALPIDRQFIFDFHHSIKSRRVGCGEERACARGGKPLW